MQRGDARSSIAHSQAPTQTVLPITAASASGSVDVQQESAQFPKTAAVRLEKREPPKDPSLIPLKSAMRNQSRVDNALKGDVSVTRTALAPARTEYTGMQGHNLTAFLEKATPSLVPAEQAKSERYSREAVQEKADWSARLKIAQSMQNSKSRRIAKAAGLAVDSILDLQAAMLEDDANLIAAEYARARSKWLRLAGSNHPDDESQIATSASTIAEQRSQKKGLISNAVDDIVAASVQDTSHQGADRKAPTSVNEQSRKASSASVDTSHMNDCAKSAVIQPSGSNLQSSRLDRHTSTVPCQEPTFVEKTPRRPGASILAPTCNYNASTRNAIPLPLADNVPVVSTTLKAVKANRPGLRSLRLEPLQTTSHKSRVPVAGPQHRIPVSQFYQPPQPDSGSYQRGLSRSTGRPRLSAQHVDGDRPPLNAHVPRALAPQTRNTDQQATARNVPPLTACEVPLRGSGRSQKTPLHPSRGYLVSSWLKRISGWREQRRGNQPLKVYTQNACVRYA